MKIFDAYKKVIRNRAIMSDIWSAVVLSTGDILLAVFATMVALLVMVYSLGIETTRLISGTYILINFLLTMQRVIRRVDAHWTTDELGERLIEFEHRVSEDLHRIETLVDDTPAYTPDEFLNKRRIN